MQIRYKATALIFSILFLSINVFAKTAPHDINRTDRPIDSFHIDSMFKDLYRNKADLSTIVDLSDTSNVYYGNGSNLTGVVAVSTTNIDVQCRVSTGTMQIQIDNIATSTGTFLIKYGDTMLGILNVSTAAAVQSILFDTTTVINSTPYGSVTWDTENQTIAVGMINNSVLQVGREIYIYGKNTTGSIIADGTPVSISHQPGQWTSFKVCYSTDSELANCYAGLATHNIPANEFGLVTLIGEVHDFNTSHLTEGELVFVTEYGTLSSTPVPASQYTIKVGICNRTHSSQGRILAKSKVYPKIQDLSGVNGTPLALNGQLMVWDNDNRYFDFTDNTSNFWRIGENQIYALDSNTVTYKATLDISSKTHESAGIYFKIDPVGENNQLIGIMGEITAEQEDTEAAYQKIISYGNGDAIYIAMFGTSTVGLEAASFHDGTKGIISTMQQDDCPNATLFNGYWGDYVVPLYGMAYLDQSPGNAITIRPTDNAIYNQDQIRIWKPDISDTTFAIKTDGSVDCGSVTVIGSVETYSLQIGSTTDGYTKIERDGTIQSYGNATCWDDLTFSATQAKRGALDLPDFDYSNIGLLFPQNNESEKIYISAQMPHSWSTGTAILPHIHYIQTTASTATFKMDIAVYDVGSSTITRTTYTAGTFAKSYTSPYLNQIAEFPEISMIGKNISCQIDIVIYRSDNVVTGDVLVKQFDIHFQTDSFGSRREYIK